MTSKPSRRTSRTRSADHAGPAARKQSASNRRVEPANGNSSMRRDLVANEIYEQATRLFAERGFAGTSLQDVADAVGLTRPALYYYVKSKDELLAKLVEEITEGSATSIAAITKRGDLDAAAKLHAIVKMSAERQAQHAARFRLLILSEAELPEHLAGAHAAGRRAVLRLIAGVIDQGVDDGTFRPVDARIAALGVLGMTNWLAWWIQPDGRDNVAKVAEQLAEMAVDALRSGNDKAIDVGPAAALKNIRQELERLERLIQ